MINEDTQCTPIECIAAHTMLKTSRSVISPQAMNPLDKR